MIKRLRQEKLYTSLFKCSLGAGFVEHLGFHFTSDEFSIHTQEVNVIREWHTPKTKLEVESFSGFSQLLQKIYSKLY